MTLEEATDELYGAPLDDFVGERTRLAKALVDEGRKDDAAALRGLRKPSVAAWVLNQLSRRNRREIDLLLDSGHRLRQAQASLLGGSEKESFEQAQTTQRDALRALAREAETILRERGSDSSAVATQISESLRAAAVSDAGRELLARGRFTKPFEAEGFDVLSQLAPSAAARPARARRAGATRREKLREATQAVKDAKQRVREAEGAARAAEKRAETLRRDAEDAEETARRAHADLETAHDDLAAAERLLGEARESGG